MKPTRQLHDLGQNEQNVPVWLSVAAEIARRNCQWVEVFEQTKTAASFSDKAPATGPARAPEG